MIGQSRLSKLFLEKSILSLKNLSLSKRYVAIIQKMDANLEQKMGDLKGVEWIGDLLKKKALDEACE